MKILPITIEDTQNKLIVQAVGYVMDTIPEIDPDRRRPAVIICPGGGYHRLSPRESEPVAIQMLALGYQVFLLEYSVDDESFYPKQLFQLAHLVRYVRKHAKEFAIDPNKIIVAGFSAGGHLAAHLGTCWHKQLLTTHLGGSPEAWRPNGLLLSYAVLTTGPFTHQHSMEHLLGEHQEWRPLVSPAEQVTANVPPCFIWHTVEDSVVPVENALLFAVALRQKNVPFELHIYPHGPHGLSLATEETKHHEMNRVQPEDASWLALFATWMQTSILKNT
ncbi:alpha/beta hydrolase [Enterococcus camelliae]|uniref:Alpha/beta hydrolase n=1 Tax=Enterococcus camelliae TaxID=453959 RepID=A0ABW5THG3_9ENTE